MINCHFCPHRYHRRGTKMFLRIRDRYETKDPAEKEMDVINIEEKEERNMNGSLFPG